MALRDDLDDAIERVLAQDPDARRALTDTSERGRGAADDALQDLINARNALLDAAGRWDRATGSG